MRNFLFFFFLVIVSLQLSAQVSTTQSLDCYNDSGSVFLVFDPAITVDSIYWKYSKFDPISFMDADTINFLNFNSTRDSLKTIKCGWYRPIYYFTNSIGNQYLDSLPDQSVGCRLTIGQGQEPILCYGDSSGILKRPVFGGDPFEDSSGIQYYYYQWIFSEDSLGTNSYYFTDTIEVLENVSSGWYQTIVTDSLNCSDTIGFLEFKDPALIVVDTTFTEPIKCRGTNTAKIGFEIFGGKKYQISNKYFYYLMLDGDTISFSDNSGSSNNFSSISSSNMQSYYKDSIEFDSLVAGEYFLHILDSNSCLMIDTVLIPELQPYEVVISTSSNLICQSDSGYLKIDSIIGPGNLSFGFDYNLIDGIHLDSIYVSSGWHQLYIEDLNLGCIDSMLVKVNSLSEMQVYDTLIHINCFGEATGSIIIDSVNGGFSPYDIQWGSVNNLALTSGTYQVNIVDDIGCVHIEYYTISESDEVIVNERLYPPSCYGFSNGSIAVDILGGSGIANYYWSTSMSASDSLYGLSEGTYSLVTLDSLMCLDTFHIDLPQPDMLVVSAENYDSLLSCAGGLTTVDLLISGGIFPYSILWNDGDTNKQRVLGEGAYSVIVTDINNCMYPNTQFVIEAPDSLSTSIISTNISCSQGGTATVIVDGGVEPISYLWNTGETTQTIASLSSGTYWVFVIDSCGNSIIDTIYLSPYELETMVTFIDSNHIGVVEILSASSSGPFIHQWQDANGYFISEGVNSPPFCEGTYLVLTTDLSNNCVVEDTLNVIFSLPFNSVLDLSTTTVFDDIELWNSGPYTYLWDNGEVTQHADICPGLHWVEVTDQYDCIVREDFQIEVLSISLDPSEAIIECNLENLDVSLEASVTGGVAPYSYEWWNGSEENPINLDINPGDFSLLVTDNNGCIEDTVFVIATMTAECVPNIFTPNGDDINDVWSLEDTFLYTDSKIRIYGRYGRLLFQSIGYSEAWDGTNKSGNEVPSGVYFYSIEIGHGFDPINGTVTILR